LNWASPSNHKDLINASEAVRYFSFAIATIYVLVRSKSIPHFKTGKRLYSNKSEIDSWITTSRVSTKEDINRKAKEYIFKNSVI
jgi:predicted DNA-binding transcriptional regulator AlpA